MAAGKSRVIYAGPTRFPYLLSDDYTRGPTRFPCLLFDDYKRRVPHTTRYPEDIIKCWGSKRKKAWYIIPMSGRFLENMGTPYIFQPGSQVVFEKTGNLVWIFFMAITLIKTLDSIYYCNHCREYPV